MNEPVQGSAEDIIKIAMVILDRNLRHTKTGARHDVQVHDEIMLEADENQAVKASGMLKEAMESAVRLSVPLIAQSQIQKDWY